MGRVEVQRVHDTCNVWLLRRDREAICVDFGSGAVLDRLEELGVDRITDVLVTHFHRDNVQGLGRAVDAGARVWVPPMERDLFTDARGHWRRRRVANSYDLYQESLLPLADVEVAGTVDEYRTRSYGGIEVYALPTPGHTMGSVTYLVESDGRTLAFSGDLVHAGGRLWSLAATQWSYTGVEGQGATLLSLRILARRRPGTIFPAHGDPIEDPQTDLALAGRRLSELMELRRTEERPFDPDRYLDEAWVELTPHVLLNTTCFSFSYALLSDDGAALLVDFGYDLWTWSAAGGDRHRTRPLLESIAALRRDHGVERIEAVVTTHYHDDHVAGLNLLRAVEGTEVWAPENVAPILEAPERYDLPCLWFDPIPVDRVLRFDEAVRWHEHELHVHPLPGHTRYAAAIELEVDGKRLLATGDQQSHESDGGALLNYQYRNRFAASDFVASAELYARLRPDLVLTGHWGAHELSEAQIERLAADGRRVEELHRELLPFGDPDELFARIVPYRARLAAGAAGRLEVELRSPLDEDAVATVELVVPAGWRVEPAQAEARLAARGEATVAFIVTPAAPGDEVIAADVTIGALALGQHAEALVTVA